MICEEQALLYLRTQVFLFLPQEQREITRKQTVKRRIQSATHQKRQIR